MIIKQWKDYDGDKVFCVADSGGQYIRFKWGTLEPHYVKEWFGKNELSELRDAIDKAIAYFEEQKK